MKKISAKFHKGFTLMEVMVSVSIFAIIVTIGIVALVSINNAYRKSEANRQTIDSLTYVLESMSRRIRTAQTWTPSTNSLTILDQDNITVKYELVGQKIEMTITNPTSCSPQPQCPTPNVADGPYDITPSDVLITNQHPDGTPVVGGGLTFTSFGGNGTGYQSYLQINLGGYSYDGHQISDFSFQTSVSKRALDH